MLSGTESTCHCRRLGFDPWVRKIPWSRKWQPAPVFLPGKFHRQQSLVGYSPWVAKRVHKEIYVIDLKEIKCLYKTQKYKQKEETKEFLLGGTFVP